MPFAHNFALSVVLHVRRLLARRPFYFRPMRWQHFMASASAAVCWCFLVGCTHGAELRIRDSAVNTATTSPLRIFRPRTTGYLALICIAFWGLLMMDGVGQVGGQQRHF